MSSPAKKVLFVCHGNICRSPLADGVLNHLAEQARIASQLQADSAGVIAFHSGEPPDSRMSAVASAHGILLSGRSRQFRYRDFNEFDLILAMDSSNYDGVCRLAKNDQERRRVRMFLAFDPEQDDSASVPDPYYGGREGFEHVYQMVMRGCQQIIADYHANTL